MQLQRIAGFKRDDFLDQFDPALRLLDHPAPPDGEIDQMAALALMVSIAALVPVATGAAAALLVIAKIRA